MVFSKVVTFVSLICYITVRVHAAVYPTGRTILVEDVPYYVPPKPVSQLKPGSHTPLSQQSDLDLVPFTFTSTTASNFAQNDLTSLTKNFTASDDVWQTSFLQGM